MLNELKRAIFSKKSIILTAVVLILMFMNAYYGGWNTALHIKNAVDITNESDRVFFGNFYGNTYRVWIKSYYMVQILTPILLIVPYILSYSDEKRNKFRYFVEKRKGTRKYLVHKILAIAIAGTCILAISELLFFSITYFMTCPSVDMEYIEGLVCYKEDFFRMNTGAYLAIIFILQVIYYIALSIFSIGITSMLSNKVAILITPFLVVSILDLILPISFQPNVAMQPMVSSEFKLSGYWGLIVMYIVVGFITFYITEIRYKKARG